MATITYLSPIDQAVARVDPQLGTSTGGADCCFRATQGVIRLLTGQTVPVRELRDFIGEPTEGVDMLACRDMLQHWGVDARFSRDVTEFRAAMAAGYPVIAATSYANVNAQTWAGKVSGDRSFDGNHAVVFQGLEYVETTGIYWVRWSDGLQDGRRVAIVKGGAMARRGWAERAMAAVGSGTQFVVARKP